MNSFASHEDVNIDILIFTKRLDTLLAATKFSDLEPTLVRPALECLQHDVHLSEKLREQIQKELTDRDAGDKPREGLNLLRVLIGHLQEQGLVSNIYGDALSQAQLVKDLGYELNLRKTLQSLLALQGFESALPERA